MSPPVQAARIYTHHRHLLLLSPKADTQYLIVTYSRQFFIWYEQQCDSYVKLNAMQLEEDFSLRLRENSLYSFNSDLLSA